MASTAPNPTAPAAEPAAPVDRGPLHRLLDPDERFAEVLFGLIMVITITGTISVSSGGREDVATMLKGALGCNLAWGIADAVMWILTTLIARGLWRVLHGGFAGLPGQQDRGGVRRPWRVVPGGEFDLCVCGHGLLQFGRLL